MPCYALWRGIQRFYAINELTSKQEVAEAQILKRLTIRFALPPIIRELGIEGHEQFR